MELKERIKYIISEIWFRIKHIRLYAEYAWLRIIIRIKKWYYNIDD